jgi:pimeloyl-ACP methyl ester carboxylesterase
MKNLTHLLDREKYRQLLIDQIGLPIKQKEIVINSIKTAWLSAGNFSDECDTVILLHGAGAGAVTWYPNIASIAQFYRVIVPDIVGYGESDKPDASYDQEYFSNWLNSFLEALNLTKVYLVGSSQGGAIAMRFTLEYPQKVEKLVLVNSAGLGAKPKFLPFLGMVWMNLLPSKLANKFSSRYLVVKSKNKSQYHGYYSIEVIKSLGGKNVFLQGKGAVVSKIPEYDLKKIKQKTLIIVGENDLFFSINYSELASKIIPNAKLRIIPSAGHMASIDQPKIFNEILIEFLKEN